MGAKTVRLRVYGMVCEDCAVTIEKSLRSTRGVKDAKVSFEERRGTVVIDDAEISPEQILGLPIFGPSSRYKAQIVDVES